MYKVFSEGILDSNVYVVSDGGEAMIVDAGAPPALLLQYIEENSLKVKHIVLTHAHYDHAHYLSEYKRVFLDAAICAHEGEIAVMSDPVANVSAFFGLFETYGVPDVSLREGDFISVGTLNYRVLSTPGHTPGSICLYSREERLMLTGDTLFMCGRGRCDFRFGSEEDMSKSLSRLLSMDGDIVFLPGHGEASRIKDERGRVF